MCVCGSVCVWRCAWQCVCAAMCVHLQILQDQIQEGTIGSGEFLKGIVKDLSLTLTFTYLPVHTLLDHITLTHTFTQEHTNTHATHTPYTRHTHHTPHTTHYTLYTIHYTLHTTHTHLVSGN